MYIDIMLSIYRYLQNLGYLIIPSWVTVEDCVHMCHVPLPVGSSTLTLASPNNQANLSVRVHFSYVWPMQYTPSMVTEISCCNGSYIFYLRNPKLKSIWPKTLKIEQTWTHSKRVIQDIYVCMFSLAGPGTPYIRNNNKCSAIDAGNMINLITYPHLNF